MHHGGNSGNQTSNQHKFTCLKYLSSYHSPYCVYNLLHYSYDLIYCQLCIVSINLQKLFPAITPRTVVSLHVTYSYTNALVRVAQVKKSGRKINRGTFSDKISFKVNMKIRSISNDIDSRYSADKHIGEQGSDDRVTNSPHEGSM